MKKTKLVDMFQKARRDDSLAVIEGVQALKHAVRFKADIQEYITYDIRLLSDLLEELAEDVKDNILQKTTEVDEATFQQLSPRPHRTKVVALAKRKHWTIDDIEKNKPIIFLEDPRDLENIGAVIRVSAAADAGAVVISGSVDIWQPAVIRGSAGLHWALPALNASFEELKTNTHRKVVSLNPNGQYIDKRQILDNTILVFGTERHGISQKLLDKSDEIISLPMKTGVSSLNLATSVAATLYHL